MTCDAVLRRIRGDDLEALLGLYKHLYDDDLPEVAPGARAAVWGEILQDDAHYYLGAFVGERLVASAFVTVVPNVARGGRAVSLSSLRGSPVLLYFSEGAGCDACLIQMNQIERDPAFSAAGITVLPIVMNTAAQIRADMTRLEVKTPFLLDDGTVSQAYNTLGKGMHEGLPGHGFVLIDAQGIQKWSGEYPSMWLAPDALMSEIQARL